MARPTLCTRGEVSVFSCATQGGKIISLCASPDLSENIGTLRYRFGRPSRLELTHPNGETRPQVGFRAGIIGAGGGDFIRFSRGETTYTIEYADGPRSGHFAGLTIHRGTKQIAELRCRADPLGEDGFALIYRAKLPGVLYSLD